MGEILLLYMIYSAHMVNTGTLATIMDALAAEVSFIPHVSNRKYMVTPERALSTKGPLSSFRMWVWGCVRFKMGNNISDAMKKRRKAMVNGGTPALRMALELTNDIPQKMTVAMMARLARAFCADFALCNLAINGIPSFVIFSLNRIM